MESGRFAKRIEVARALLVAMLIASVGSGCNNTLSRRGPSVSMRTARGERLQCMLVDEEKIRCWGTSKSMNWIKEIRIPSAASSAPHQVHLDANPARQGPAHSPAGSTH